MTANEIRSKIGLKPSDDPKANELMNSNMGEKTDIDNYVGQPNAEIASIPDESSEGTTSQL